MNVKPWSSSLAGTTLRLLRMSSVSVRMKTAPIAAATFALNVRRLHIDLTHVYEALMSLGTWPAALKAAHALIGQPVGAPREPVLPLDAEQVATLSRVLAACGAPVGPKSVAAE